MAHSSLRPLTPLAHPLAPVQRLTLKCNPAPTSPLSTYGPDLDLTYWGLRPPHERTGVRVDLPAERDAPPRTGLVHSENTVKAASLTGHMERCLRNSLDQLKEGVRPAFLSPGSVGTCPALAGIRALHAGHTEASHDLPLGDWGTGYGHHHVAALGRGSAVQYLRGDCWVPWRLRAKASPLQFRDFCASGWYYRKCLGGQDGNCGMWSFQTDRTLK